jgi:hypothetical protein
MLFHAILLKSGAARRAKVRLAFVGLALATILAAYPLRTPGRSLGIYPIALTAASV